VKGLPAAVFAALTIAAVFPAVGGATNECKGIQDCISVPGPWVLITPGRRTEYLLSCPNGNGIVAGLDSQATSSNVRVSFDGQLGAPVSPGVTTTRSALFHALTLSSHRESFQPFLGCVRGGGGGGRSTVSARSPAAKPAVAKPTPAGAPLDRHAQTVVLRPGLVRSASVRCPAGERLAGSWSALAFRTKNPPDLAQAKDVELQRVVVAKGKATVTALATDALSPDARAVVQVGVECAA
jgi:hypothetical protein